MLPVIDLQIFVGAYIEVFHPLSNFWAFIKATQLYLISSKVNVFISKSAVNVFHDSLNQSICQIKSRIKLAFILAITLNNSLFECWASTP